MGEYARQHILEHFGVDIGDDRLPVRTKLAKKYGCKCGRMFISQEAKNQHLRDKHDPHFLPPPSPSMRRA